MGGLAFGFGSFDKLGIRSRKLISTKNNALQEGALDMLRYKYHGIGAMPRQKLGRLLKKLLGLQAKGR